MSMQKKIEAVCRWNKPGEPVGAREVQFALEVPVRRTTTEVEDALLALWDPHGYGEQMITVDMGEYPNPPTFEQVAVALRALPAQRAAKAEQDRLEEERRRSERLERDRQALLEVLAEGPSAKHVYADGRPADHRLVFAEADEELAERLANHLVACRLLRQQAAEEEEKKAAEKLAAEQAAKEARAQYIREWAAKHGSERLRTQLLMGLDGRPLYLRERLAADLGPEAELDNDGHDGEDLRNPTADQLKTAVELASRLVACGQIIVEEGNPAAVEPMTQVSIREIDMRAKEYDDPDVRVYVVASWRPGPPAFFGEYDVRMRCDD